MNSKIEMNGFPKLNSEEADFLVGKMRERLGPDIIKVMDKSGLNANHMFRFQYIAHMCRKAREERGMVKSAEKGAIGRRS